MNTKRTTLSATVLVLASGFALAFGTTAFAEKHQQKSNPQGFVKETVVVPFQEADIDRNGALSEEEYNEAMKKSRQQWENQYGFTKEAPSSQIEDVAPTGTETPMKEPTARPQQFESETPSSQIEDVAPPGTAAPMKEPKARPQEFEKETPSSQIE